MGMQGVEWTKPFFLHLERELKSLNTNPHILRNAEEVGNMMVLLLYPLNLRSYLACLTVMSQAYSERRGWCESIQRML